MGSKPSRMPIPCGTGLNSVAEGRGGLLGLVLWRWQSGILGVPARRSVLTDTFGPMDEPTQVAVLSSIPVEYRLVPGT